jgi:uncharacterized HAD superfamily protein
MEAPEILQYPKLKELLGSIETIWIDIDGVLVDTVEACIRKASVHYQTVMQYTDWKHWNPHENHELQDVGVVVQEDTVRFFHDIVHNPVWNIPPISWAQIGVQRLVDAWKTLIALTGRADDAREVTTNLVERHFPGQIPRILFSNHDVITKKKPKSQVAKENGIWLMIEDNIHYAIELAGNGIPTILLDRPWNSKAIIPDWLPIFRLTSWEDIVQYL